MTLASVNPRTGSAGTWTVEEATPADVARAAERAAAAFAAWRDTPAAGRALLLRVAADRLEAARSAIVETADFETGLGDARLNGELNRTTGQLRAFANLVEAGSYVEAVISTGDPRATPPRPDVRRTLVALGPVGVFTPSNFPLAFGVAGGDTASALAAGCPVIAKGHPSHPHTSARCAHAVSEAVSAVGAPEAVFALVQSRAPEVSRALVEAPEMAAIGFTGSQPVGRTLCDLAAARPHPIPFYGELGSLNPVFVSPSALATRSEAIADGFAASMTLGCGQFCTKPGLLFVPAGAAGDRFVDRVVDRLRGREPGVLLNAGLQTSLGSKVARTGRVAGVQEATGNRDAAGQGFGATPRLFVTDEATFFARPELADEHFGPVAIVIRCDAERMAEAAAKLDGQLTATLHAESSETAWAGAMLLALADKAGRLIWNGYPTGVAVVPAMQHGGPYPSSTSVLHTSVGAMAIRRFLRPVAYQNVPDALLPPALQDANPLGIERQLTTGSFQLTTSTSALED